MFSDRHLVRLPAAAGLPPAQFYERLGRGMFRIPEGLEAGGTTATLSERELDDLLDGIDVTGTGAPTRRRSVQTSEAAHSRPPLIRARAPHPYRVIPTGRRSVQTSDAAAGWRPLGEPCAERDSCMS